MTPIIDDLRELCTMPVAKSGLACVSAWALQMVGHPESAAASLFVLMLMDLFLGLMKAWKQESFQGRRLTRGAFKFFRYWLAVAVFVLADEPLKKAFPGMPLSLRDTFIAYLAINEAFSCIEKLAFFGMPVPEPFLRRLRNYRDDCLHGWDGHERRNNTTDNEQ